HHFTEYIIVFLFAWGMTNLGLCFCRAFRERYALTRPWLKPRLGPERWTEASQHLERLEAMHRGYRDTQCYSRIHQAIQFIDERKGVDGFREYLETLAERDLERLAERYSFTKFVISILPILGLIGTVVHFGIALSGLSLEGIESKIPTLLGSMGTAFNTTFTAMSCMATTTLVRFVSESYDGKNLQAIDRYIEKEVFYRFSDPNQGSDDPGSSLEINDGFERLFRRLTEFESLALDRWVSRLELIESQSKSFEKRQEENFSHLVGIVIRQMQRQLDDLRAVSDEIRKHGDSARHLTEVIESAPQWVELQHGLAENLVLLRESARFENVIHELTAAIHLLTARQGKSSQQQIAA
ncbi:MAG: MotA/TolQ/ExbB proton channel family protein, partial [Planctomycetes bacterium]|nr:MotA/TolQ/ExbB proton channel family protein [Planctomycetota bacterium]